MKPIRPFIDAAGVLRPTPTEILAMMAERIHRYPEASYRAGLMIRSHEQRSE